MNRGFSLVELSIVLVILGLLTGGILAGQSLIRAAELRAVGTEYSRYITAAQTFRDKYFALPGDFRDATRVWGFAGTTAAPACVSNSGIAAISVPGTCDGNGNGQMDGASVVSTTSERPQFWKHLALAGLIEGNYTGLVSSESVSSVIIGQTVPASRISNAGWWPTWYSSSSSSNSFAIDYGNTLVFGARGMPSGGIGAAALKPEEAWNIDTKLDDGRPGRGKVLARNLATCTTTSVNTDFDANYLLTSSDLGCALNIANAF